MISLLENAAFLGFLIAIFYVIYWSVRNDDKADENKPKKFELRRKSKQQQTPSASDEVPDA